MFQAPTRSFASKINELSSLDEIQLSGKQNEDNRSLNSRPSQGPSTVNEAQNDQTNAKKYDSDLQNIKGTKGNGEEPLMLLNYTCGVCNHKQARTFTKRSYDQGVVIIRCEKCENMHLIADRLNWFGDKPWTIKDDSS